MASEESLDFWAERLETKGYPSERGERSLSFRDYDGLRSELVVADGGAGTVHHIAWHSSDEDHTSWRPRVSDAGMHVTPVIGRDYFLCV